MNQASVLLGAMRYEFRMQIRRRAVWVVLAFLGGMVFLLWYGIASDYLYGFYTNKGEAGAHVYVPPSLRTAVLYWALLMAMFLPVGVGLVLADRLARDRQSRVDEIFATVPGALGARLFGKYLGGALATLMPVAVLYAAGLGYMLTQRAEPGELPLALAAFAALVLPGSLFVAGWSIALPALLKVPLYQILFVGYWFWAGLLTDRAGVPTVAGTVLNASGRWASNGLFQFMPLAIRPGTGVAFALGNIALIVVLGLLTIVAAWRYLLWQRARQ